MDVAIKIAAGVVLTGSLQNSAFANPQGGTVVDGQATIQDSGNRVDVYQSTDRAIIDWQSFSIAPGEITEFHQPSSGSIALNRVTGAEVLAEDMLFATLDPTLRRMKLPHGSTVILSDTVGFISNLPTHLVAAFRATLEEVVEADLILHVRDMSDPDRNAQAVDVETILKSLGVGESEPKRMLEVWNKVNLLEADAAEALRARAASGEAIVVSALKGDGIDALMTAVESRISGKLTSRTILLTAQQLPVMSWIYERGRVKNRVDNEDGSVELTAEFTAADNLDLDRQLGMGPKPEADDF
mgnify:CR=1 FL=1